MKYKDPGLEDRHTLRGFTTPKYLTGCAGKIISDLEKAARLYNGHKVRVYKLTGKLRCPNCVNDITGEIMLSHCPECGGTGRVDSYENVGEFWAYTDFDNEYRLSTETGMSTNPGSHRDTLTIIGAPILEDQDFLYLLESGVIFKIYNVEPKIIAMAGTVVAQAVAASKLESGATEYGFVHEEIEK